MYALNITYPTTAKLAFKRSSKLSVKFLRFGLKGIAKNATDMFAWAARLESKNL